MSCLSGSCETAGKALFFKMNLHEKSNCFISLQVI
nr:MAG TPA: hypothetical protein [Caudoviricetes sp.]